MKKTCPYFIITQMGFIEKILMPCLDWIQIEVSSLCNASCFYCPHTTYKKTWKGKNLSFFEFSFLIPYLKKVKLVYLQGWGEPFCNPDFFRFVEIAKKYGCKVGTTTNGMLIEKSHIEKIVDMQIDIIAFSLTGIKKNNILRTGTNIDQVLKVIEKLNEEKIKKRTFNPQIHIAYMLLKSNIDELNEIPEFFSTRGINHVIVSLLDFIPNKFLEKESLTPKTEEEFNLLEKLALNVINKGKKLNLEISFNIAHPLRKGKICSENPIKAVFVNSLGYVCPCVFTGISADGFNSIYFGNITEKALPLILRSKKYKEFKKKFLSHDPSLPCNSCPKIRIVKI